MVVSKEIFCRFLNFSKKYWYVYIIIFLIFAFVFKEVNNNRLIEEYKRQLKESERRIDKEIEKREILFKQIEERDKENIVLKKEIDSLKNKEIDKDKEREDNSKKKDSDIEKIENFSQNEQHNYLENNTLKP